MVESDAKGTPPLVTVMKDTGQVKVLMVDDDASFLIIAHEWICKLSPNTSVVTTTDPTSVVPLLRRANFDVVVSDYIMSGMDGLSLLEALRKGGNEIPFILLTGQGREEVVAKAFNLGANYYLQKGIDNQTLWTEMIRLIYVVADHQREQRLILHRLRFEGLVAYISTQFGSLSSRHDLDQAIDKTLAILGEFTKVDRSYVFQFEVGGSSMTNTHEWCDEGIQPEKYNLQEVPTDVFPWWTETLFQGRSIYLPTLDHLPPEADREHHILSAQKIQSLVVVPLTGNGQTLGFIGLDSVRQARTWTDEDISLVREMGDIIVGGITRFWTQPILANSTQQPDMVVSALKIAFNLVPVILLILDSGGRVVEVNPYGCEVLGYTREEVVGGLWLDSFVPSLERRRVLEVFNEVRSGGEETTSTFVNAIQTRSGEERVIAWRNRQVRMSTGEVGLVVSVGEDVTDSLMVKRQTMLVDQILYHDISNKLANVQGILQLLEDGPGSNASPEVESAERHKCVKVGLANINKALSLLKQARSLEDSQDTYLCPTDLEIILEDIRNKYNTSKTPKVTVEAFSSKNLRVLGGPLLGPAVEDLVTNAVVHSHGTEVRVEVEVLPTKIGLAVDDDGQGIDPDLVPSLFRRGVKGKTSTGSGLGLYLVRKVVSLYGGRVNIRPSRLGGTRFEVELERSFDWS